MNKLFTLIAVFCSSILFAQENGLQFNDSNSVIVANASGLIANTSNISMSCWIYAQNMNPTFPNLDGICGFRDDVTCDFYLVQLNGTQVEARFRNSTGGAFTITSSSLQLFTWLHYVLTYDGSMMRLYTNGVLTDSTAANGTISDATQSLYLGDLIYTGNNFNFQGILDEFSLWNKTLAQSEIDCIYKSYVDSASSGLSLYYKFNQGIASGVNTGVDTLIPTVGNLPGALSGFLLSGSLQNWVPGLENYTLMNDSLCPGDTVMFGSQTLTQPGFYTETYTSSVGCDSIVGMRISPIVNDSVIKFVTTLRAYQANATYQWLDCNNGSSAIAGETNRDFTPLVGGDYAVIVNYNNCTDTSNCINFIITGIEQPNVAAFNFYPNPVSDYIVFTSIPANSDITITDVSGRIVLIKNNFSDKKIDVGGLTRGVYFMTVSKDGQSMKEKFLKN